MPVVQVGALVVGLDGGSPALLGLPAGALRLPLGCFPVLPSPRLVLVVRVVLLVLHPQPLGLLNEGALVTLVQQPARGSGSWGRQQRGSLSGLGWGAQQAGPSIGACSLIYGLEGVRPKEPQAQRAVISPLKRSGAGA